MSPAARGAAPALVVPALGPVARPKRLTAAERTLPSGLTVLAVRRTSVPMVEVRLRVPFSAAAASHPARAELLADSLLSGTDRRSREDIASTVQGLGGSLSTSVDADRLLIGGSALVTEVKPLLALLGEVLTRAAYPGAEVARDRARLIERLTIARSQAGTIAHEALAHRLFGRHPYALDMPQPEAVAATTAAQVRRLHAARVRARGATLILVGDFSPKRVLNQAATALADWTGDEPAAAIPALPPIEPGAAVLLDRPASVQSALRLGGAAVGRTHPDAPALNLANLVFGGYFSSRWVENIREDKGYTYSPRSAVEHHVLGSVFTAAADVATEVTAAALLETQYELGRIASLPVTDAEVDAVRQYAIGTLALSVATQSGLASTLSSLAGSGLGLDYLAAQPGRLAAVTTEQVSAAAATYLAPSRLVTVIVGDAAQVSDPLRAITALAPADPAS
ncbi:MAG: insulinase family protein [Actinomycetota bacterium]|nr:insulinase family protein [Actinomycetota bacterium]